MRLFHFSPPEEIKLRVERVPPPRANNPTHLCSSYKKNGDKSDRYCINSPVITLNVGCIKSSKQSECSETEAESRIK